MTIFDARTIAERLGLPEEAVRALQRRGFLRRLDLDEAEIRERLWRGHLRSGLPLQSSRSRAWRITLDRRSSQ